MRGSCVPRISMHLSAVAVWLLAACGGQDTPPPAVAEDEPAATASARPASGSFDPCTLLTKEEVAAAVGWQPVKVESVPWEDGMGKCQFAGGKSGLMPPQELEAGILKCPTNMPCYEDLPNFASSKELAAWRTKLYEGSPYAGVATITPLEGMRVPAIDHDMGVHAIEMYIARNRLAYVQTWAGADTARALAEKVLARIR